MQPQNICAQSNQIVQFLLNGIGFKDLETKTYIFYSHEGDCLGSFPINLVETVMTFERKRSNRVLYRTAQLGLEGFSFECIGRPTLSSGKEARSTFWKEWNLTG